MADQNFMAVKVQVLTGGSGCKSVSYCKDVKNTLIFMLCLSHRKLKSADKLFMFLKHTVVIS